MPFNLYLLISMTLSFFLFFLLLQSSHYQQNEGNKGKTAEVKSLRKPAQVPLATEERPWHVCGLFPEEAPVKKCLTIKGKTITQIQTFHPRIFQDYEGELILNTEDFILPGLLDLHHDPLSVFLPPKKNPLPVFSHRYDEKFRQYLEKNKFLADLEKMKKEHPQWVCQGALWGEWRAFLSGVTLIRPSSFPPAMASCPFTLGIKNFQDQWKRKGRLPLAIPEGPLLSQIGLEEAYFPRIFPLIHDQSHSYSAALEIFLSQSGIKNWLLRLSHTRGNLLEGLALILDDHLLQEARRQMKTFIPPSEGGSLYFQLKEKIKSILLTGYPAEEVDRRTVQIMEWLLGREKSASSGEPFLGFLEFGRKEKISLRQMLSLLKHPANTRIPEAFKEWVVDFHYGRRAMILDSATLNKGPLFLPLAQGRTDHPLSHGEFSLLLHGGLHQGKNLILLHGSGMTESELSWILQEGPSLVWTLSQDLLLFGDTLKMSSSLKAFSRIGPGSGDLLGEGETLLSELKKVHRHLEGIFPHYHPKETLNLATHQAARVLQLEDELGSLEVGRQADFFLFSPADRSAPPLFPQFWNYSPSQIQMVVRAGDPLYGRKDLMQVFSSYFADPRPLQKLPSHPRCPWTSDRRIRLHSKETLGPLELEKTLRKKIPFFRPLFSCP